LFSVGQQLEFF